MGQERRFVELLSSVAREVTKRRVSDVCCGDLTLEQYETLQAAAGADLHSIGRLSAHLGVDVSTMSRNVSVLERNGHLTRARSSDDGRVVHVLITPKGRRALETLRCDERSVLEGVYARLPAGGRARVVKALELLAAGLGEACAPGDACCAPVPLRKAGA